MVVVSGRGRGLFWEKRPFLVQYPHLASSPNQFFSSLLSSIRPCVRLYSHDVHATWTRPDPSGDEPVSCDTSGSATFDVTCFTLSRRPSGNLFVFELQITLPDGIMLGYREDFIGNTAHVLGFNFNWTHGLSKEAAAARRPTWPTHREAPCGVPPSTIPAGSSGDFVTLALCSL